MSKKQNKKKSTSRAKASTRKKEKPFERDEQKEYTPPTPTQHRPSTHEDEGEDDIYTRTKRQIDSARGGAEFYKLQASETVLRPIPYTDEGGRKQLMVRQTTHWLSQPEEMRVPCPGYKDCALCQLRDEIDTKEDSKSNPWNTVRPRMQYLVNAVVKGEPTSVVIRLPKTVAEEMTQLMDSRLDVCNLKSGRNFIIYRRQAGKSPVKYTVHLDQTGPSAVDAGVKIKAVDLTRFVQAPPDAAELDLVAKKVLKAYER